MPRINIVPKARKPNKCSKCQNPIPIGAAYQWIKPRYGGKRVRCMRHDCRFRPTDLSGAKTAVIDEAVEDAQDVIAHATCYDDIKAALDDVAGVAHDVAGEYQEASDNWAGGNGNEEFQEKADACETFADDLEGWEYDGDTDEDTVRRAAVEDGDDDPGDVWERVLDDMREDAINALGSLEVP